MKTSRIILLGYLFVTAASLEYKNRKLVSVSYFDERSADENVLSVTINGADVQNHLNLEKSDDFFTRDHFIHTYQERSEDGTYSARAENVVDELKAIQERMYSDESKGSLLLVDKTASGPRLTGYLDANTAISYELMERSDDGLVNHYIFPIPHETRKAMENTEEMILKNSDISERNYNSYSGFSSNLRSPYTGLGFQRTNFQSIPRQGLDFKSMLDRVPYSNGGFFADTNAQSSINNQVNKAPAKGQGKKKGNKNGKGQKKDVKIETQDKPNVKVTTEIGPNGEKITRTSYSSSSSSSFGDINSPSLFGNFGNEMKLGAGDGNGVQTIVSTGPNGEKITKKIYSSSQSTNFDNSDMFKKETPGSSLGEKSQPGTNAPQADKTDMKKPSGENKVAGGNQAGGAKKKGGGKKKQGGGKKKQEGGSNSKPGVQATATVEKKPGNAGNENSAPKSRKTAPGGRSSHPEPEVHVMYDSKARQVAVDTGLTMIEYFALMFGYVRKRYAGIKSFQIEPVFYALTEIDGITFSKILRHQPMCIDTQIQTIVENRRKNLVKLPIADIVMIVTGEKLCANNVGVCDDSSKGIAVLKGVCRDDGNVMLVRLEGMFTEGHTMAHEIAHSLGSPHDPNPGPAACHWNLGYIMSYVDGPLENKRKFTSCSVESMKNTLSQPDKECVFTQMGNSAVKVMEDDIGKFINYEKICRLAFNDPNYRYLGLMPYEEGLSKGQLEGQDKVCEKLHCFFQKDQYSRMTGTSTLRPNDGWPCGPNKACKMGKCVRA